jgi:general secretion pathway protein L
MARWLGIDISKHSARIAVVRSSYRRLQIEQLREAKLADHESPAAAVRAAFSGLRADAAATALSGERAFVRFVSLPAAAQKELGSVLSFEVESTLPFELDDCVMDHRLLSILPGDAAAQLPILAGVAFSEEIRECISLVQRGTGIEPQRVGVGPLPLVNLAQVAPGLAAAETAALIEIDEDRIEVLILRRGEPRFARSLSLGTLGLPDTAHAMNIKRGLRQTIGAWRMQGGPEIAEAYLVGSGRWLPGVEGFFENEVGVRVVDLGKLQLDGLAADQEREVPRFAKAIALALGLGKRGVELNLRQGALEAQQSFQFLREKTPLLAGLGAAIFVSFGFAVFAETRALEAERALLERELEVMTETRLGQKTSDVKLAQQLLDNAVKGKADDPLPPLDAFDVMVEFSNRVPKDVVHDVAEFEYNRGNATIKGIVPAIEDAETIKHNMAEHECFKDVTISRTTRIENQDKQKYTLEFTVDCGGEDKAKGKKGAPKSKPEPKKPEPKKGEE